jgi:chromosome segregation ATPase
MDQQDNPTLSSKQATAAPSGAPLERIGDDDLLGVIDQVQSQLDALKSAHSQRDQMRSRLETWDQALTQREAQLKSHAETLAGEQSRLEQWNAQLEHSGASLAEASQQLDRDLQALAESQQQSETQLKSRRAELETAGQQLQQRESALAQANAALEQERKQLESARSDLAAREESLSAAAAEIGDAKSRIADLSSRLDDAERAATRHTEELRQTQAKAEAAGTRADTLARELEGVKEKFRTEQDALCQQLQTLRDDLARSGEAQSQLMAELDRRNQELAKTKAAAAEVEQMHCALQEAQQQASERESALAERDTRLKELNRRLDHAKSKLGEFSRSLQEQADLVAGAAGMAEELHAKDAQIRKLEEQLSAAQSGSGASSAESASLRRKVEAMEQKLATVREELETAQEALQLAEQDARRWRKQAEALEAAGPAPAAGPSADIPAQVGAAVTQRWNRLRLMKSLLREQGEKLHDASEALRARYQECEEILAQKEELEAARAELAEMQRRVRTAPQARPVAPAPRTSSRAPKSRTMFAAGAAVLGLAGLLGASWAVSGHIAPATYAARAVLKADGAGAGPDLLAEWQRYHESLLTDANMIETAADRMNRRGIISLGTPGLLAERLNRDMSAESPQPGTLIVELRGGGRKTERELEVLITALASQGNATRERRADGLGTLLAETPSLGEPLSSSRMIYAGGMFAGGSGLMGLLGLTLWRRTTSAKAKFEKDHEAMSDEEASWSQSPESFGRPRL